MTDGSKAKYTEEEISQVPCERCGKPSTSQWQICADRNVYRGICTDCDIELNEVVLKFMGFLDWAEKMEAYMADKRPE